MTPTSKPRAAVLLAAILTGVVFIAGRQEDPWVKKARVETAARMGALSSEPITIPNWPPEVGKPFPDVALLDHEGRSVPVQSWKGKPTLVEIVAMTCAGCQAFSGGNSFGGFEGFAVQSDLGSIENYYRTYTRGHDLYSDEIHFVQIIIYNLTLSPARPEDIAAWRSHFHFDAHPNTTILTGGAPLSNKASFNMIPGFLLLDRDLTVLFDSTGHQPKHSLYGELLPAVDKILR